MAWSIQEKTFCVETYFETKSFCAVQRSFRRKFQCRHYPDKRLIHRWTQKFREHGTVLNLNAKGKRGTYSGRPKSARSQENIDAIRNSVSRSPRKSLRRRSQELGINRDSIRRIVVKDLQLYRCMIQIKHKLTQADREKRVAMCRWFCDKVDENRDFLDDLWFSDEAHFLLSVHVNSKNIIFWDSTPPEVCLQRPLHSIKCTACVVISKHGIIGPYWFPDESERSLMVNSQRYIEVLQKFWTTLGRRRGFERDGQWFQQDGATPHTSNETLQWLRQRFGDRLISRMCEIEWAPHSPDLNPPDFYLLGYLKDNVYESNLQTIPELKRAITGRIRRISVKECVQVIDNFANRIHVCLRRRGAHLEHILERQ